MTDNFVIKTGLGMELKRTKSLEKAIAWLKRFGTERKEIHDKLPEKRWEIFCLHCSREIDFRTDCSSCVCVSPTNTIQTTLEVPEQ